MRQQTRELTTSAASTRVKRQRQRTDSGARTALPTFLVMEAVLTWQRRNQEDLRDPIRASRGAGPAIPPAVRTYTGLQGLPNGASSRFYQLNVNRRRPIRSQVEAKAGDIFLLHGLLPHTQSKNYLHYARAITNPHVNMHEPFDLNRADGDYVSVACNDINDVD